MSIIKKILLVLPIIFIATYSQLSAEEVKKIGKYKDWESMVVTEATGKVCFAQSSPILQAPKSNKRDAKLFIAFRPAEQIINEISVTAGYEFNSNTVTAQSGKNKFKFDIKEQGFEFDLSENYGEPLTEGTYKVKHDIYNSEGEVVININESVEFKETTDTIMGYDVFKYNNVFLTTEDLNG